jgi:hypothetical protein
MTHRFCCRAILILPLAFLASSVKLKFSLRNPSFVDQIIFKAAMNVKFCPSELATAFCLLFTGINWSIFAQQIDPPQSALAKPWTVVERGPHTQRWEAALLVTNELTGQVTLDQHSFVQLEVGGYYFDPASWPTATWPTAGSTTAICAMS